MTDPRFNSIPLAGQARREAYRQAREVLMGGCGMHTLAVEQENVDEGQPAHPHTIIENPDLKPPAGVKFWLRDKDAIYPLRTGLNSVGRMPDNDVVIDDACVSRRHCAVVIHATRGCEVHDTASKNGTFVNGRRINGPCKLACGDEIKMCDHIVVFMSDDPHVARRDDPHYSPTRAG